MLDSGTAVTLWARVPGEASRSGTGGPVVAAAG